MDNQIRLYEPSDYKMIVRWYEARRYIAPSKAELSKIGYIVPHTAAGFLYQTDSDVAFLEGYVSNPQKNSKIRANAIVEITNKLIETAINLRFKKLIAITKNESVIKHCIGYEFRNTGMYFVYAKEI